MESRGRSKFKGELILLFPSPLPPGLTLTLARKLEVSARAIPTHHFTGPGSPSKALAELIPWTWDVLQGIPFLGPAIRVSKLVSLGRWALASSVPHHFSAPPHPPSSAITQLEGCSPSPEVRVSGGSEVTLSVMSSMVPFSGRQLSQSPGDEGKGLLLPSPAPNHAFCWAQIFITASGSGKGRSPRHSLPPTPTPHPWLSSSSSGGRVKTVRT